MFYHGYGISWLIVAIIAVVPFWRLSERAGYSPWLSLLILIPLVNIVFIYFLAFSEWPAQRSATVPGASPAPPPR